MIYLKPKHSFKSVATKITNGLEDGEIVLGDDYIKKISITINSDLNVIHNILGTTLTVMQHLIEWLWLYSLITLALLLTGLSSGIYLLSTGLFKDESLVGVFGGGLLVIACLALLIRIGGDLLEGITKPSSGRAKGARR